MNKRFKELRIRAGFFNRYKLALEAGVAPTTVDRIERGISRTVREETGLRLAKAMQCDPRDIYLSMV